MASFREIQYLLIGLFPIVWKEVGRRWKHDELCRTCQKCTLSKSKISPTLSEWRRKAIYPSPHIGTQLSSLPWLCERSEVLRRKLAAIAILRLARPQPRPCSTQMSRFSHIFPTVRIDWRSEEEAWNWVVVRGSTARPADFFWSSPFFRDTMPSRASCYVPEGTNVKKLCKWGVFPSEDVQLVKRRLCGVSDGRGGCKNASLVRGELSFHRFLAKEEQRREWTVKICREKYPTYTKHLCLWCPLRWRETSRYFSVPARFVWTKPAKKRPVESRQPGCKIPGRRRDGGWWEHQQGSWQTPNLQRQLMKRKIPCLWKATFKTTSRHWKLEY